MSNVRLAAARALLAIDAREGTLGAIVDAARQDVEPRDHGLLVELVTGVLRWRNALDAVIASAARRSVKTIDPPVLTVLRLGAYQLRYLDRVPDHAVVHESVAAVRALGVTSAASLVNAALRAMIRRGPAISLPARPTTENVNAQVNYLSITLSHPAWLVRRWIERIGFDAAEAWCRFNNAVPELAVRSLDGTPIEELQETLAAVGVPVERTPYVSDALRLPAGALGRLPADLRARIWVQDEGAQLIARLAGAQPGERVLDLCAAPGGKTLVLAADLELRAPQSPSLLVAADYRAGRVAVLRDTLRRAGLRVPVVQLDGRTSLPIRAAFDCVVVDAPCSGLGTIRREPDLKWTRSPDDLPVFAIEQGRLLAAAADVVAPGGRLVYATCSSEPEENAGVVDAFLASNHRFDEADPASIARVPPTLLDGRGHLATRPDRHGLEVFHGAVLVRHRGA